MTQPRKMKHRKWHKGRSKGNDVRGTEVSYGSFGLKSLGTKWITANQLEAARKVIARATKRKGKLWVRIFPHKPITAKGGEVGMGGGKGAVSHYVFPIKPGRVIFELDGVDEKVAREAFQKATDKLPIKVKFIKKGM
ncbi:MAG: 50S ribosomal protein L16 [Candidatus Pacebacteria bacterium]|nr:50S ribosomal protein L16 [Candidatus Paceibacterota bacterium]